MTTVADIDRSLTVLAKGTHDAQWTARVDGLLDARNALVGEEEEK